MKKSLLLALFVVPLLFNTSCKKEETEGEQPAAKTTYDPTIESFVTTNCLGCHGAMNPAAGLKLTNYAEVKAATESGKIVNRINDSNNPMPPTGMLPLTERQKIDKWIADGYLE